VTFAGVCTKGKCFLTSGYKKNLRGPRFIAAIAGHCTWPCSEFQIFGQIDVALIKRAERGQVQGTMCSTRDPHMYTLATWDEGDILRRSILSSSTHHRQLGTPLSQYVQRAPALGPAPHHPGRVEGRQEAPGAAGAHGPEGLWGGLENKRVCV